MLTLQDGTTVKELAAILAGPRRLGLNHPPPLLFAALEGTTGLSELCGDDTLDDIGFTPADVIVVPSSPQTAPKANDDPENPHAAATECLSQLDTNVHPVATEARLASCRSAASAAAMLVSTPAAEGSVAAEAAVVGEHEGAASAFEGKGVGTVPNSSAPAVPDAKTMTVHVTTAENFDKPVSPPRSSSFFLGTLRSRLAHFPPFPSPLLLLLPNSSRLSHHHMPLFLFCFWFSCPCTQPRRTTVFKSH
jgi:hypothetical protein